MPGGAASIARSGEDRDEDRGAQRFALYIRSAKLVCDGREFVCVIRDVSASGVKLRLFHDLPQAAGGKPGLKLCLQTGDAHHIELAWSRDREAGFSFSDDIDLDRFLAETSGLWPKRPLRFNFDLPVRLSSLRGKMEARLCNLSQQGVGVLCEERLAIDQLVRIECDTLPEIVGKVRWRDGELYGLVLENTFRLDEFALLVNRLQGGPEPVTTVSPLNLPVRR